MSNEIQKFKKKVRNSKAWKTLRHEKNVEQKGLDPITGSKLTKLANLHHMCLIESEYNNLTNKDNFVLLNRQTHETIHILYKWYCKDRKVISRILELLEKMKKLND